MTSPSIKDSDQIHLKIKETESPSLRPEKDESKPQFRSDVDRANILSRLNFLFIFPLILKIWRKEKKGAEVSDEDLITFPYSLRAEVTEKEYRRQIQKQLKNKPRAKINTVWVVLKSLKGMCFLSVFVQFCLCCSRMSSAYFMKKLIDCYFDPEKAKSDAYWWAAILGAAMMLAFYSDHHWNDITNRLCAYARAGIISMLYKKITRLSLYSINKVSAGQLVNLAANDVNTIEMLGWFFPSVFTGWFTIIGGGAILWHFFGVTCLLGLGYIVLTMPLQALIAKLSSGPRNDRNIATDERVRITSEVIQDIRILKMYAWENRFVDLIGNVRKKDIKASNKVLFSESISRALATSCHYVAAFLIFMLYYVTGGELTVSKVFSAYFLLRFIMIFGAYFLYNSFTFVAEARLFFQRLDKVMEVPEMDQITFNPPQDSRNAVEFDNFTGYWTKGEEANPQSSVKTEQNPLTTPRGDQACLSNLDFNIKKGSLNAVIGTVGSGKSSLLLSFTGEMPQTIGELRYKGSVAYVEQEPTIFAGTFRESILFGKPYREDFYQRVIKACCLEGDLKLFQDGDQSQIGERGNNLSGGQKARLALARAVYADADIYLLDDPLSAVDAKVARRIYDETILGLLKDKTVILVTHQVHFVHEAKNIIVMDGGRIQGIGSFEELKNQGIDVDKLFSIEKKTRQPKTFEDELENQKDQNDDEEDKEQEAEEDDQDNQENPVPPEEVDLYPGKVSFKTYGLFFKEMGFWITFCFVFLYTITQFGEIAFGRILGAWTTGEFNLGESLGSLGGLAIYMNVIQLLKNVVLTYGFFKAARHYHDKMLNRIVRSPVSFFDKNPVGRVLNRFSNDLGILDKFFPNIAMDLVDIFMGVATVVITLAIIEPILLAPTFLALIIILCLAIVYYPALKQTKSFDLSTRGPLFSLYSSTINGISILRTFGQTDLAQQKFDQMLHTNTKGNVNFYLVSRLLGFCVDFTYTVAGIGMIYIITARIDLNEGPSAGAIAAFVVALIKGLTGVFQHGVRQFCGVNVLMASAARCQAYCNLPSEAPLAKPQDEEQRKAGWPQEADIHFNKVYMKYNPDADFTIKDLDLMVNSGEKIACVGRTGSGKSTIINLLFRLREIDRTGDLASSSFIKINKTDIQPLGLHFLRNNLSIIPQTPFIFSGTIKQNLDPFNRFTDQEVWSALAEVRLKNFVEKLDGKLETKVSNASSVFSVGQKQLVCLARVLLKPCKLLVLDEATSNMDTEVDDFIQKKIMEKFPKTTVFTVAHRLATIANYDKVLVMDQGKKVEFDEPFKLLTKERSDEIITRTDGYFGSMVLNTGPKNSKRIFKISKEAYEKKYKKN